MPLRSPGGSFGTTGAVATAGAMWALRRVSSSSTSSPCSAMPPAEEEELPPVLEPALAAEDEEASAADAEVAPARRWPMRRCLVPGVTAAAEAGLWGAEEAPEVHVRFADVEVVSEPETSDRQVAITGHNSMASVSSMAEEEMLGRIMSDEKGVGHEKSWRTRWKVSAMASVASRLSTPAPSKSASMSYLLDTETSNNALGLAPSTTFKEPLAQQRAVGSRARCSGAGSGKDAEQGARDASAVGGARRLSFLGRISSASLFGRQTPVRSGRASVASAGGERAAEGEGPPELTQVVGLAAASAVAPAQTVEFAVSLHKRPDSSLGIGVDPVDGRTLRLDEIREDGLFGEWNLEHPGRAVRAGDRIVEVNGRRGFAMEMYQQCIQQGVLAIVVERDVEAPRISATAASGEAWSWAGDGEDGPRSRRAGVARLFRALDFGASGRLRSLQLQYFATLRGFRAADPVAWETPFQSLCSFYGIDPRAGATVAEFLKVVSDESSALYCSLEELGRLASAVEASGAEAATARPGLLFKVFRALDVGRRGSLGAAQVCQYLRLCGMDGNDAELISMYGSVWWAYGTDDAGGLDVSGFADFVNEEGGDAHLSDGRLRHLLAALQQAAGA
mmetsp:Transcript_147760/g.472861  ORF Transcript_147760/g.472861 Transcript_147760/m.472861 type:complete len:619 (-) Transcript_147760:113-1969(-)